MRIRIQIQEYGNLPKFTKKTWYFCLSWRLLYFRRYVFDVSPTLIIYFMLKFYFRILKNLTRIRICLDILIGLAFLIRIHIEMKSWIGIQIRIETKADPQHCFFIPVDLDPCGQNYQKIYRIILDDKQSAELYSIYGRIRIQCFQTPAWAKSMSESKTW